MYSKLYASMYDGTLVSKGPWQALVTFQQLLILADAVGHVDMTADAIVRRTSIPIEVIGLGLAALALPDADSRSPSEGGRRIVLIDASRTWGWRIVNWEAYRKMRSQDERRAYQAVTMRAQRATESAVDSIGAPAPETLAVSAEVSTSLAGLAHAVRSTQYAVRSTQSKDTTTALVEQARRGGALTAGESARDIGQQIARVFASVVDAQRTRAKEKDLLNLQASMIFLYWTARFDHPRARLDDKRRRRIVARLKENNGDVGEVLYALDGASHDAWIMGTDAQSTRKYDDLDTILRDRGQVERFAWMRQKFRQGEPHKLIPRLMAALQQQQDSDDVTSAANGVEPAEHMNGATQSTTESTPP